jgi:hypothetical protein
VSAAVLALGRLLSATRGGLGCRAAASADGDAARVVALVVIV